MSYFCLAVSTTHVPMMSMLQLAGRSLHIPFIPTVPLVMLLVAMLPANCLAAGEPPAPAANSAPPPVAGFAGDPR